MKGALNLDGLGDFPHVREWLSYARAASLIVEERGEHLSEEGKLNELIRQNVIMQIQHLKTHPYVAARLAAGRTEIHGWVYDIATGGVVAFDQAANAFVPVAEHYKDAVNEMIAANSKGHADA
jgi:carbonic anhydrase